MRIIRHGSPESTKRPKIFQCDNCGCKFEADNTEYKMSKVPDCAAVYATCICPECGEEVWNLNDRWQVLYWAPLPEPPEKG